MVIGIKEGKTIVLLKKTPCRKYILLSVINERKNTRNRMIPGICDCNSRSALAELRGAAGGLEAVLPYN